MAVFQYCLGRTVTKKGGNSQEAGVNPGFARFHLLAQDSWKGKAALTFKYWAYENWAKYISRSAKKHQSCLQEK